MRLSGLLLLFLISLASAEFIIEEVDVLIHDIQPDGSARVTESIKVIITGEECHEEYDSGFDRNDLSFWSTVTGLSEVKQHVNPAKVEISDFRLRPQPRGKCNPIQEICHGELLLDYTGDGIFIIEEYKPRTTKYTIDPEAISFTTTQKGNILLDENTYFRIKLPEDATILDLNPAPEDFEAELPAQAEELTWNDMILVKFSVIFEVEKPLEKEVSEFFYGLFSSVRNALTGEYGSALLAIIIIVIGGYLYITIEKRTRGK